jgi:NADPH-dependent curcumin reductase CurA
VYFENVGGAVWDAVMPLLNNFARVPICGLISHYNQTELPPGPDRLSLMQGLILQRSLKIQGFIVSNYINRVPAFIGDMGPWVAEGKIVYREDIVDGLENAPKAFLGLFTGDNFGKLVVKVS